MGLQVWLPLTKDLRNQGLSNVTVTNNGATFNSAGKLGGCYTFTNQTIVVTPSTTLKNSFGSTASLACWVKISTSHAAYAQCMTFGTVSTSWTAIYFGIDINGSGVPIGNVANGSGNTNCSFSTAIKDGQWHHLALTYESGTIKSYMDGVLKNTVSTSYTPAWTNATVFSIGGNSSEVFKNGDAMNDVRLYNHCLSPMEVKELAKGLVLHYPLSNDSIQQMNNCYNYPRFENSTSSAGWNHWGSTGHIGTYGQSTDSNYIFRQGQTYTHWVANGTGATYNYLLYQSPAFEGGTRSLQCICKEENGVQITNNICYATWNARSGGTANNSWTSIIPLGNGFYWCKCENIQQDGSNNLVGIYIRPGYKVYFSECYLENDTEICSNPFFQSNIVYDCSGFCNNGTAIGELTLSNSTPKYLISTKFDVSTNSRIEGIISSPILPTGETSGTLAAWVYPIQRQSASDRDLIIYANGVYLTIDPNGKLCTYAYGKNIGSHQAGNITLPLNTWSHVCTVWNQSGCSLYINGVLDKTISATGTFSGYSTYGNLNRYILIGGEYYYGPRLFNGMISDVRIYATALSADDVKSLYQNSAYIDNSGNVYGAVHMEV